MKSYTDLVWISVIVVYIIDISGFTSSWRNGLARLLKVRRLRPLPPLDCSKCMVWWSGLLYTWITDAFSLEICAFIALLSMLSIPLASLMIFIREGLSKMINLLFDLCKL